MNALYVVHTYKFSARTHTHTQSTTHHSNDSPHKLEVGEMLRVDPRGGVDLEGVAVLTGILKQTVHGVQHLVGQVEEPLPRRTSIIQTLLPTEHNVETSAEVLRLKPHNL